MKKIYKLLVLTLIIMSAVFAQTKTKFYGDTPTIHKNPYGWGYITGTNEYGDVGKFQRFDFEENVTLKGMKFYFAVKSIADSPDAINLVIRSVGENGAPADLLYSKTTTTDLLDTAKVGNEFSIDKEIKVSGSVFIGFELTENFNDTLAIFADADGEGEGKNRAWELFSDGAFNDLGTFVKPDYSWGINVDLWIAAIYEKEVQLTEMFFGDTPTLIKNPYGAGYIAGTNGYGDIGKYQKFDFYSEVAIKELKYFFGYKEIVGDADSVNLVIRGENSTDGTPGDILATIKTTTADLDTTLSGSKFSLKNPLIVNGNIYVGFEFTENSDDTVAIYTDKDGEGDGVGGRAWEQFSDGSFNDFGTSLFSSYSWGIDVDLWIAIYYTEDTTVGIEEISNDVPSSFSLEQNYPNPFNPTTKIKYSVKESSEVEIAIYNLLGEKITTLVNEFTEPGTYVVDWTAKDCSSGIYFYSMTARFLSNSIHKEVKKMMLIK